MKNEVRPIDADPLTLEQLREMDGKPVWIVRLEDNLGWWAIVRLGNDRANTDYGAYFMLSDYGKTWLAYAYQPAHIDREALEPCGAYVPKIVTNADRIRATSDEVLAMLLCRIMDCSICKRNIQRDGECDNYSVDGLSQAILNWLQQPAEGRLGQE